MAFPDFRDVGRRYILRGPFFLNFKKNDVPKEGHHTVLLKSKSIYILIFSFHSHNR
jgi:hypothetical protein